MTKALLRTHPTPKPDEDLNAYALRLAVLNCWPSASAMFKEMGYHELVRKKYLTDESKKPLSALNGHSIELLNRWENTNKFSDVIYDQSRVYRIIYSTTPVICPDCVRSDGYIKSDWQVIGLGYCEQHLCDLVSHCPNCSKALRWAEPTLSGICSHCSSILRRPNSNFALTVNEQLETLEFANKTSAIKDMFLASQRVIRPFDSFFELMKTPYELDNWPAILLDSLRLLNDSACALSWHKKLILQRACLKPIGELAVGLPYVSLLSKLENNWPITNVAFESCTPHAAHKITESPAFTSIKKARQPYSNEELKYHADTEQMSEVLGLEDHDAFYKLVDKNLIPPLKQLRILRDSIFDLKQITKTLEALSSNNGDWLDYDQYWYLLEHFGVRTTDWLQLLMNNKVTFRLSIEQHTLMESIQVDRTSLQATLVRSLKMMKQAKLSSVRTKHILGLNQTSLAFLAKNNNLKLFSYNNQAHITGQDFINLIRNFLPVSWLSKLLQLSPELIVSQLLANDAELVSTNRFVPLSTKSLDALVEIVPQDSLIKSRHNRLIWLNTNIQ
ncbi:TniQ family protein [Shewanella psychrotolerans]|uniref:TniQ family protein n=1 Tax=Shewanella psychrotolerans TaxID=2864206 RepID=UPI001C655C70|nr:TniQ family protein [Shewanella psychrotolerans]QYK03116.1 TniQ family protein [Shewanella psychrotolerans]